MNSTQNFDLGHCGMGQLTKCENGIRILDNRTRTIPFVLIPQSFAMHFAVTQSGLLHLFAHTHQFVKTVLYIIVELVKRNLLVIRVAVRKKSFHSHFAYFHMVRVACYALHIGWLILRIILLSGDVETYPGPE